MKDQLVRLALSIPFFLVIIVLEATSEGLLWCSSKTMWLLHAIIGDE